MKTYYGFAPAVGTHNIVVSASASCILYAVAGTYTGVKQSGFPNASGIGNPLNDSGSVTTFQATTTTANPNAWAVLVGVPSTSGTATAGSNTTIRQQQTGHLYYGDSNGPVSPAGAIGLNWTKSSAADWAANYFSISPTVATLGSTATSTYTYDKNGNLTQVGTTTFYTYDYKNEMISSGNGHATTTYAYDPFGNRISQVSSSTSTFYPNKFYSITSGTSTVATSTDYLYAGSTLLGTVDQKLISGVASGTAIIRYNHTDNLGSTNVTSDASGTLAQWFDYAPYGSVIASSNTGTTTAARGYIGQYYDATGLNYLNARYYNGAQGQFTSEDPVFLGNPSGQNLSDPQSLNSYSYSENDPIIKEDPSGKCPYCALALIGAGAGIAGQYGVDVFSNYESNGLKASDFYSGLSSPQTYLLRAVQGAIIGATGGAASEEVFGTNLLIQSAVVGGVSGATGAAVNHALGDPVTLASIFWDTTLGGFTFGASEIAPGVPGRLPNFGTQAFYTGAHTIENAFNLGIGAGSNYLSSIFTQLSTSQRVSATQSYNAGLGGGGGSGGGTSMPNASSLWTTPSGAVVTFGGSLIAGPAANSTPQTR